MKPRESTRGVIAVSSGPMAPVTPVPSPMPSSSPAPVAPAPTPSPVVNPSPRQYCPNGFSGYEHSTIYPKFELCLHFAVIPLHRSFCLSCVSAKRDDCEVKSNFKFRVTSAEYIVKSVAFVFIIRSKIPHQVVYIQSMICEACALGAFTSLRQE
jgi:hypothetical protein